MRRRVLRDDAISSVIGAIIVIGILGMALVSVNSFSVPKQGQALEVEARERAETSLVNLAGALSVGQSAPFLADLPMRPESGSPPLLAGVILSPARAEGRVWFDPAAVKIRVSHVTNATQNVSAGDPMRVDLGGGKMRIYSVGNASAFQPVGGIGLSVGGAYLDPSDLRLELGALSREHERGSQATAAPSLLVSAGADGARATTRVAWRLPILTGDAAESSGGPTTRLLLTPGPLSSVGGGARVANITIEVETTTLAAWQAQLEQALGARGVVTVQSTGPDAGIVTAVILPPGGTPANVPAVELDLSAIRYVVQLTART